MIKINQHKSLWMLPSLLNTRLKRSNILEQAENQSFPIFVNSCWQKHDLAKQLLTLMFLGKDSIKLKLMQQPEVIGFIYLFSVDAQFRDRSSEAAHVSAWKQAVVKQLLPAVEAIENASMMLNGFLAQQFRASSSDVFWSLPKSLFDVAVDSSDIDDRDQSLVSLGFKTALALVDFLCDGVPSCFNYFALDTRDLVFFRVVAGNPHGQVVVRPGHIAVDSSVVLVMKYKHVGSGGGFRLACGQDAVLALKVSSLLSPSAAPLLQQWSLGDSNACAALTDRMHRAYRDARRVHASLTTAFSFEVTALVRHLFEHKAVEGPGDYIPVFDLASRFSEFDGTSICNFDMHTLFPFRLAECRASRLLCGVALQLLLFVAIWFGSCLFVALASLDLQLCHAHTFSFRLAECVASRLLSGVALKLFRQFNYFWLYPCGSAFQLFVFVLCGISIIVLCSHVVRQALTTPDGSGHTVFRSSMAKPKKRPEDKGNHFLCKLMYLMAKVTDPATRAEFTKQLNEEHGIKGKAQVPWTHCTHLRQPFNGLCCWCYTAVIRT